MPLLIVRPAAVGTYDTATLVAGANKVVAVDTGDPVSHDENTSYIRFDSAGNQESYTVTAAGTPAIGTINSLSLKTRDNDSAGQTLRRFVRVGGTDGVNHDTVVGSSGTYTNRSVTPLKSGSVAVLPADILWSSTNFQMAAGMPAGVNLALTSLWMELDYAPPSGGWESVIVHFLGPVLGAALLLSDMPRLIAAYNRAARGECVIHGREAVELYRDLRANRYPRHFLLAGGL